MQTLLTVQIIRHDTIRRRNLTHPTSQHNNNIASRCKRSGYRAHQRTQDSLGWMPRSPRPPIYSVTSIDPDMKTYCLVPIRTPIIETQKGSDRRYSQDVFSALTAPTPTLQKNRNKYDRVWVIARKQKKQRLMDDDRSKDRSKK